MQMAYQFPERVERLVLVSSGGLGRQVTPLLRAVALPAAEYVLPLLASQPLVSAGTKVGGWIRRIGLGVGSDISAMASGFASLQDIEARRAFVHTARSVIEIGGQRVSATDKLYLAEAVPTLILWGARDTIIPARHGIRAHELMPGSRLRIFDGARHFPHHDDPAGFAAEITDFVDATQPSEPDEHRLRRLVVEHGKRAA
jgi:pimeloyl-ACP methyl ester carboxylesterase